jgi:hypothetical protein
VILGERTSQFARCCRMRSTACTSRLSSQRNGVPRDRAPSFATASPFIVGASKERKTELSFDVARALGVPRTTGQATRLTSKPTGIEK